MQKVNLLFKCQPGKGKELVEKFRVALVETRAYDGCISVGAFTYSDNPDSVILLEEWESKEHYERYMAWRLETGLAEMLEPILAVPLEIHYLEATSA